MPSGPVWDRTFGTGDARVLEICDACETTERVEVKEDTEDVSSSSYTACDDGCAARGAFTTGAPHPGFPVVTSPGGGLAVFALLLFALLMNASPGGTALAVPPPANPSGAAARPSLTGAIMRSASTPLRSMSLNDEAVGSTHDGGVMVEDAEGALPPTHDGTANVVEADASEEDTSGTIGITATGADHACVEPLPHAPPPPLLRIHRHSQI